MGSVLFATLSVSAASIPLNNSGFETITGSGTYPQAAGWSTSTLTALHSAFPKSSNGSLGTRFGFVNPSSGSANQTVATAMAAHTTYIFKGNSVESGTNADLRFEIGYDNGGSFALLAGTTYNLNTAAPTTWTLLDGVTHTTGSTGPELGKNIIVRLLSTGTGTQGVWFDEVSLVSTPPVDTDGDGLPDDYELAHTIPPSATALNPGDDLENGGGGDGLTNLQEYQIGTDPTNPDSDNDGLTDGREVNSLGSDPLLADTDSDGLQDGAEVDNHRTSPLLADTDGDGFSDSSEITQATNPLDPSDPPGHMELTIKPDAAAFKLSWGSQPGMLYHLRDSLDLSGNPSAWNLVEGEIPATPPFNTRIVAPSGLQRFYVIGESPRPPQQLHVSASGDDGNNGSTVNPLKTISAAAAQAMPGDTVTVRAGVYRERINPPRGGLSDNQRITYQAAPGEEVVLKGSEIIRASLNFPWQQVQNDTWMVVIPNSFFGGFNPYADVISGEWYAPGTGGWSRHTGAVYLNDNWLTESQTLNAVLQPAGAAALWFAQVDATQTTIRAQFKGVDPNVENVEINVRQSIFYPSEPGRNFITVRGFTMRHAATPWAGAMSEQVGLVGTHWSRGWIIEDNTISHSMNTGITLGRYDLGRYGIAKPPITAPGFVTSCELALEHGWSKANIGSHIVRNNHISHCEKNGIHGSLGGVFSTIEGNTIHDIGIKGWIGGADVAGLKLLGSNDGVIRNNHIYRCGGSAGVWLDWMAQGTRLTGNLLHDNGNDLFSEVNHGPFLIDHNLMLSGTSVRDWSQGGAYAHNLIRGSIEGRTESRQTPYFTHHTLDNMRLSTIRKTDHRFHNNLFVGGNGTAAFNAWAANVQAGGNVYLAGANPSTGEGGTVVNAGFNANVTLTEGPLGEWWLEMAVDPAWLSAQTRPTVTSALLGTAVVPNAPFVQPDDTPYLLDKDYNGTTRNAANPAPGPFELTSGSNIRLKVWPVPH